MALWMLCVALVLTACAKQPTLDFRNAQIVNGKVYVRDANTPFSGIVTNVPNLQILSAQEGAEKFANAIGINILATLGNIQVAPGMLAHGLLLSVLAGTLCDVHVKDGMLDGQATCKSPQSDSVRLAMGFRAGRLDGALKLNDPRDPKHLVSEVSFKDGQPDGKQETHSPKTRKLTHIVPWSNGVLEGNEEGFDEVTGNRTLQATLVNGKYDGKFVRYAPDGNRVVYAVNFVRGQMDGVEEAYDPLSGTPTGRAEYAKGKLNGVVKRWDANGNLVSEEAYRDGTRVAVPAIGQIERKMESAESIDACVGGWTDAYRKEKGEDALIAMDQITEWESWCRAGKRSS
ncbi:conserved exported protein of unknown function [Cupriavidus taiwanensis]|uniref:Toxin-antitoxin system YwqK family antitoxin n=2 Tax=Cupriavidus taiwanensis TaxID=164546 RepID=A0A375I8B1_9BURK|nr:conserved exported protein of unknown function [Cupriavidus taiwanensis]